MGYTEWLARPLRSAGGCGSQLCRRHCPRTFRSVAQRLARHGWRTSPSLLMLVCSWWTRLRSGAFVRARRSYNYSRSSFCPRLYCVTLTRLDRLRLHSLSRIDAISQVEQTAIGSLLDKVGKDIVNDWSRLVRRRSAASLDGSRLNPQPTKTNMFWSSRSTGWIPYISLQ